MVVQKLQRLLTRLLGPLALAVLASAFFVPTAAQAANGTMTIELHTGDLGGPNVTSTLKGISVTGQLQGADTQLPSSITFTLQNNLYTFSNGGAPDNCQSAPRCTYVVTVKDSSGNTIGSLSSASFSAGTQNYGIPVTPTTNKTGTVSGVIKVHDPNLNTEQLPICGSEVTFTQEFGSKKIFSYTLAKDPGSAGCNTNGKYNFAGLTPGKYTVSTKGTYNGANQILNFTSNKTGVDIKAGNNTLNITAEGSTVEGEAGDVKPMCDADSLTWVVCPVISVAQKGAVQLQKMITGLLTLRPLNDSNPEGKALKLLWSAVRNIANVFFIVIFFAVIFGTALGLDNYTVKTMLPRLIAAAILIQFSFLLWGLAYDVTHVASAGVETLASVLPGASEGNRESLEFVGVLQASGLLALGVTILVTVELIVPVLLAILSALLGAITVYFALEYRHILLDVLVVSTPFLLVLDVLPNTRPFARKAFSLGASLLFIAPAITGIFVASNLISIIIAQTNAGPNANSGAIAGVGAALMPIIACFMTAGIIAKAPGIFGQGVRMLSNLNKAPRQGLSNLRKGMAENRRENGLLKYGQLDSMGKGNSVRGRLARVQSGAGLWSAVMRPKGPAGRRLDSAVDKAATDAAVTQARSDFYDTNGRPSLQSTIQNRQHAAYDKLLDQRAAELSVALNIRNISLDSNGFAELEGHIKKGVATGDEALVVAATQRLVQSKGGMDHLQRNIREQVFGGDDKSLVSDRWQTAWTKGVAASKAGDAMKPPVAAFSNLSPEDIASMDAKELQRALDYFSRNASDPDVQQEVDRFNVNVQQVATSDYYKGKWTPDHTKFIVQAAPQPGQTTPAIISAATVQAVQTGKAAAAPAATPAAPATPAGPVIVNVPQNPGVAGSPTAPATWQQTPTGLVVPGAPAPGTIIHPAVDRMVEDGQDDTQDRRAIN